jgi:glutamyl-tRNA reductase
VIDSKETSGIVRTDHFSSRRGETAVRQLFRVAATVDSMVVGDVQILNQVKEAFNLARDAGSLGPVFHRLMQATLHVGKRVRAETSVCEGAVSVSYAAVELANKIFADLSRKAVLLIGAGETGELTLKHLQSRGIGTVTVANRTRARAEALVAGTGGTTVDFDRLGEALAGADIVISSVQSPGYVLGPDEIGRALKRRGNTPLFLIDIGVPRNVNPAAGKLENVFLYDIDALSTIVDRNMERRKAEIPRAEAIVEEELRSFFHWYNSLQAGPAIHELRSAFEQVRQEEVERNIHRFHTEDRELVDLVTRRIVNKLLHGPMTVLRKGAEDGRRGSDTILRVQMLRELFGIGGKEERER